MGRMPRWLRGLLGGKKSAVPASSGAPPEVEEPKKKQRWGSFVRSFREKEKRSGASPAVAPPYEDEEEQSKRAIAVATATAAVAEAAVAAAQAAAAVVRLTSSGRVAGGGGKREEWAAVKIQAAFRAYLARRALIALKGLVKLQALVRGNIVRKQAAETLRCMQALVRVQARARACRALRSDRNQLKSSSCPHPGPATPEKLEQPVRSYARRPERSSPLKRNSSKQTSMSEGFEHDRAAQSSGLRWLDQWMEERCLDSSKLGMVAMSTPLDDEKNAKILEIDTGRPHYSSKRKSNIYSSSSPLASDQLSHSFPTVPDSPSKDSTVAQRSISSPSSVDMQQSLSPLRFPIVDGCDYGESPQFFSASSRPPSSRRGQFTPAKSECSWSLFSGYSDYPNYMANTESSRAKVRSQSAPKQRPDFEKSGSMRRVSGVYGLGQQQQQQQSGSAGAVAAAQRSASSLHAKFTNKAYPGSGRLDRLGMPMRI